MVKIVALILGFTFLFGNEHAQTDIVPRTINFIIFISIIYYLLNDKIREFFSNRTKAIQSQLEEVEDKLEESQKEIKKAKAYLEESKKIANELIESTKKDIPNIKNKVISKYDEEIAYLKKSIQERMELERKKVTKEVVEEVIEELLKDGLKLNQKDLTQIVMKKVA